MKADVSAKIYKSVFGVTENHFMVNKTVKAVIINFGDERGDIIVENDNFGTRRKYADFTEGKKKAGLNPLQIVFSGLESAIACRDRYILWGEAGGRKMRFDEEGFLEEPCLSCDKAYVEDIWHEWCCDEKECPYTVESGDGYGNDEGDN